MKHMPLSRRKIISVAVLAAAASTVVVAAPARAAGKVECAADLIKAR